MNRRGVTLIELLMTIVIGSIAMLAIWPPFVAERIFWNKGKRQTEAQRDAQMALRAIARDARQRTNYIVTLPPAGPNSGAIGFLGGPAGGGACFIGGPSAFILFGSGQLVERNGCDGGPLKAVLIDGVRSKVASFTVTPIIANRLVRLRLVVTHQLRTTDPRTEQEILETEIYLRNGT